MERDVVKISSQLQRAFITPVTDDTETSYHPGRTTQEYIKLNSADYRDLSYWREKGWRNPEGDKFFQTQRKRADKADSKTKEFFFNMMQQIGYDLDTETNALTKPHYLESFNVFDICLAPGGFSQAILDINPTANIFGTSLPRHMGGHDLYINTDDPRVTVQFMDVTMLYSEMHDNLAGTIDIPDDHPDADQFIFKRPYLYRKFDLIICDGMVLRTHERPSYRETVEGPRLLCSQLVMGLQRISPGGTMVVLLHKAESWKNLNLFHTFSKFSEIQLYKHPKHHSIRSSFYLIAKNVAPTSQAAVEAVREWKADWARATFNNAEEQLATEDDVMELLGEFGDEYLRLCTPVWRTQAQALQKASFVKDKAACAGRNGKF